jgi:hypothetical protein
VHFQFITGEEFLAVSISGGLLSWARVQVFANLMGSFTIRKEVQDFMHVFPFDILLRIRINVQWHNWHIWIRKRVNLFSC